MILNKENWNNVLIGDMVDHIEINERNSNIRSKSKYVNVSDVGILDLKLKGFSLEEKPSFTRTFKQGQLLFAKRWAISSKYPSKLAIADIDGICSPHLWALETKEGFLQDLLPFLLQANRFHTYCDKHSAGSLAGVYLKWGDFSKYRFKIPPLEEQNRILNLFLNIEEQIINTIKQEKVLRDLQKKMIDGFINNNMFGNLVTKKIMKEYRFEDCAKKLLRRIDPIEEGIERIVAGGNLESQDFKIRTWGTVGKDILGPAFHVMFEPGDILFGSRRTYLRKVSFADFRGVCANTTFVVKSKENKLLQDLLKHIMLSERFIQYSIAKSKGSTNPYINWKDLNDFKFKLPDLETQRKMANILDDCIANAEIAREQSITLKKLKHKLLDEIFD